jgi:hypothetical protein
VELLKSVQPETFLVCVLAVIGLSLKRRTDSPRWVFVSLSSVPQVSAWCVHHVSRHNTPIHNIISTAPQLNISQKTLGTLPEDGNVIPKNVGATVQN